LVAVADQNGVIHVWNLSTGKKYCAIETKARVVVSLALSSDGNWLASSTRPTLATYAVGLWDVATGKAKYNLAADQKYVDAVAFTPNSKPLATVGWHEVRLHDVSTGRERCRTKVRMTFSPAVAFSPDSKSMVTAERNSGSVHRWDVATAALKP